MRKNNLLPSLLFPPLHMYTLSSPSFSGKTRSPGSPQRRGEQTFFELVKITRRSIRQAENLKRLDSFNGPQFGEKLTISQPVPVLNGPPGFGQLTFFSVFALVLFPLFGPTNLTGRSKGEEPEFFRFRHHGFPKRLQWWSKKQVYRGMDGPTEGFSKKKCIFGYQPTESTAHPLKNLLLADLLIGSPSLSVGGCEISRETNDPPFPFLNRKTIRPLT